MCKGAWEIVFSDELHYINKKLKLLVAVWNAQVKQWDEQNKTSDPHTIASACPHETFECASFWLGVSVRSTNEV